MKEHPIDGESEMETRNKLLDQFTETLREVTEIYVNGVSLTFPEEGTEEIVNDIITAYCAVLSYILLTAIRADLPDNVRVATARSVLSKLSDASVEVFSTVISEKNNTRSLS